MSLNVSKTDGGSLMVWSSMASSDTCGSEVVIGDLADDSGA